MRGLLPILAVVSLLALGTDTVAQERDVAIERTVERSTMAFEQHVEATTSGPTDDVARFYRLRSQAPAWTTRPGGTASARQLLAVLRDAEAHGLRSEDYDPDGLAKQLDRIETQPDRFAAELALTRAALRYASDLTSGRVRPEQLKVIWETRPRPLDVVPLLARAADGSVRSVLDELAPSHRDYERLRRALRGYRQLAEQGGWPELPADLVLEPGDEVDRETMGLIEARLAAEGHLSRYPVARPSTDDEALVYDERIAEAVRSFQRAHGLVTDGVLGPSTIREMNVPVADRVEQIALNLERWRWIPDELGELHVRVNVPGYELEVVENGQTVLESAVVVGQRTWKTPMLEDHVEEIVFNPWWHVPTSIERAELQDKSSAWLRRNGFERWSDRWHQRPGPRNPLGRVKFVLGNDHAVYLHDTSSAHLFDEPSRAFSHGCIRVARPFELARLMLADDAGWDREAIDETIESGETVHVDPQRDVKVWLLYFTAMVEDDGRVHFYPDVYGVDRTHARLAER